MIAMRPGFSYNRVMTKRFSRIFIFILLVISTLGCISAGKPKTAVKAGGAGYAGIKTKIGVSDFEIQAAQIDPNVEFGLREMFGSCLESTGRFVIVDPAGADVLVKVSLAAFDPRVSGGSAGLGGGGGMGNGFFGGLLGVSVSKAYIALDIRLIKAGTSNLIASKRIEGFASDVAGKPMSNINLARGLAAYANTPMEKAIRISVDEAVRYITQVLQEGH